MRGGIAVRAWSAAGALSLLFGTVHAGEPPPQDRALTVGVMRRDGIVVPFAGFDGRHWREVWPAPQRDVEVPIDLRSVPARWWGVAGVAPSWQLWTSSGAAQTVDVKQPDLVPANCLRQVGLRTTYTGAPPLPPFDEHPYPKDGLAVAPPRKVEPIEILDPASAELLPALPAIAAAFNDMEMGIDRDSGHPVPRRLREGAAPAIEAAYAFGSRPRIYYVEAAREYRSGSQGRCRAAAVGGVWLARNGGAPAVLKTGVTVQDCDRSAATYMYPLGVIRIDGHVYWLAQIAGWDEEYYTVIEIRPAELEQVLIRFGGAC